MKPNLYIETSIPSYLTAEPSRDFIATANQEITRAWWNNRRSNYELYVSEFVLQEAQKGNPESAKRRLDSIKDVALLQTTVQVIELADAFLKKGSLPETASVDALHISIATIHRMDFLLTWNCTHIANAHIQKRLRKMVEQGGYELPIICTPNELMGELK
jgi:hypothetical protein